jgi:hypothetical protein
MRSAKETDELRWEMVRVSVREPLSRGFVESVMEIVKNRPQWFAPDRYESDDAEPFNGFTGTESHAFLDRAKFIAGLGF